MPKLSLIHLLIHLFLPCYFFKFPSGIGSSSNLFFSIYLKIRFHNLFGQHHNKFRPNPGFPPEPLSKFFPGSGSNSQPSQGGLL